MKYTPLGRTALTVSAVSFGTGPLGGLFGDVEDGQAQRIVADAIDLGVNFFDTSPYYGSAEARLGQAIRGKRDHLIIGTKAGRWGYDDFDFSPARIRSGVENSLRLLGTDYVDILQLHDIEFAASLEQVLTEGYTELVRLRDAGKCRYIGMTGYPLDVLTRALLDTELDVLLTYAHGTLLDDSIATVLQPVATDRGVGLINAAAVALGLLTPKTDWVRRDILPDGSALELSHPATTGIRESAERMIALCADEGVDISFIANQYAIQRSGCATTVVGTVKSRHLKSAIEASTAPIDEDLLDRLLALRPDTRTWS